MTVEEVKERTAPIFREFGVRHAAVFGSVARGEDRPESDVDMLVRLGRPTGMAGYMRLIGRLEECLQSKVDLVTEQSLNPRVQPYVARDLRDIYEG
jgi:predicted nucleotidyltransferase